MSYVTTVVSKQENDEENIRIHCQSQLMISLAVTMETDCKQNMFAASYPSNQYFMSVCPVIKLLIQEVSGTMHMFCDCSIHEKTIC